jgi:D-beta-D-heptose 7-phosphate kinase / D-beta-D-heptose 1-phosphate adenosyltransferase
MTPNNIPAPTADLVTRLAGARVLVVGDLILDRFVYGRAERLSREAPIPVLLVERESTMLGGAGNVVRNLSALGATARIASAVGADATGEALQAQLTDCAAQTTLLTLAHRPSTLKLRAVAGQQQLLRIDYEQVLPLTAEEEAELASAAAKLLKDCDVLVLSDYGLGLLSAKLCQRLITVSG